LISIFSPFTGAGTLAPGAFGENLTLAGVDITGAVIGERWSIGSVVLEVCSPRQPCRTFAGFWGVPDLIKRFTVAGRTGAYLRVLQTGSLAAGDRVEIVHRPAHGLTVGDSFRAITGDVTLLPRLLEAPEFPEEGHRMARRRLGLPA